MSINSRKQIHSLTASLISSVIFLALQAASIAGTATLSRKFQSGIECNCSLFRGKRNNCSTNKLNKAAPTLSFSAIVKRTLNFISAIWSTELSYGLSLSVFFLISRRVSASRIPVFVSFISGGDCPASCPSSSSSSPSPIVFKFALPLPIFLSLFSTCDTRVEHVKSIVRSALWFNRFADRSLPPSIRAVISLNKRAGFSIF
mmetsp:Transcript_33510/g.39377  ORF Transcript_33510/g.39377 Transcript_33510/m.39377 type:complete len:202 (-) Transcript_33510:75-680(-)